LNPPEGRPKTRLNGADRAGQLYQYRLQDALTCSGNTPLHLAMESGHGEAAAVLIEAGADRERVSNPPVKSSFSADDW
jgi:26S proteasome non-ATPase regulatory subunit 10